MNNAKSECPDRSCATSGIVGARPTSAAFGVELKSESTPDRKAAGNGRAPSGPESTSGSPAQPARRSRLWLWFVLAFIVQLAAWVAWFTIANQHRVATVPLVTTGASK